MQTGEIWTCDCRSRWLVALIAAASLGACSSAEGPAEGEAEDEPPAIPVETARPVRGDIDAMYTGTAPIEAFAEARVIAKVGGELREILVEEGDSVAAGQLLARLDGDRLRLEKDQAGAKLRKLESDYQRNIELKEKGLISDGDFEKIQFEMEALKATFDLAALELGYTELRAPIDGVISNRYIKIGNTIDAGAETFQVTSLEPLISYLHVPEREFRRIDPGQTAMIEVDALQGQQFAADVARVSPVVDPETGTFKITIEVSDPTRTLKPGMFGRIRIVYDSRADVQLIPRGAVLEENGETMVFVVSEGRAEKRRIRTGYSAGGNVEVTEGLEDDDEIVIVGQNNLKAGSRVSVIGSAGTNQAPADEAQAAR